MSQEELIGKHPSPPNIFNSWLICEDIPVTETKKHRALKEVENNRYKHIRWISSRLVDHHYTPREIRNIERKKEILKLINYEHYANNINKLPNFPLTKKGNFCEVLLSEYIISAVAKPDLVLSYKLRYNPNIDQSMKGDDVLVLDLETQENPKIYFGEAKFRKRTDKNVIREVLHSIKSDKAPTSLSFLIEHLSNNEYNEAYADIIESISIKQIKNKGRLIYIGFILGCNNTKNIVEKNFSSFNKNAIIISLSVKYPEDLVFQSFNIAKMISRKMKFHEPR